jgi:hypothetical protein
VFAGIAVALMVVAIVGTATGRPAPRAGAAVRVAAVLAFGAAVALNIAAH